MHNNVILAAIKQTLSTDTGDSLLVDYDEDGNPILKVAPAIKFAGDNR